MSYVRDAHEIYRQSFATIRAEADLSGVPADLEAVVVRMIHACGMTDLVADLVWSDDAGRSGRAALAAGAPVLADCEMVAQGVTAGHGRTNQVISLIRDEATRKHAEAMGNTRSAAVADLWRPHLDGAVVAIGNAPTALFHLLDMLEAGAPRPALIVATPVGFVGAAESKAALIERAGGVPFITVKGRRGGSAMASAAVNALLIGK
ncbi:precorrin-8X methylmutase [Magnetospirillum aberrantis]|uniref:Precorrin-8X methylmutase n=1 Tax=Magnetospirillum aberrantis SpK TaxID=908842 RepID=A0A7C9URS7_9PROT|nr:precorrin-8X methylmutase [Magnetospirillum aberrantis]NFV78808.1 precorrin-8X methylmutase [Magnetospirillum aberrantis SpK]